MKMKVTMKMKKKKKRMRKKRKKKKKKKDRDPISSIYCFTQPFKADAPHTTFSNVKSPSNCLAQLFTVTLYTPPKSPPETWYQIQNLCLCANQAKISHKEPYWFLVILR